MDKNVSTQSAKDETIKTAKPQLRPTLFGAFLGGAVIGIALTTTTMVFTTILIRWFWQ